MEITYRNNLTPTPEQIIALYENAGLPGQPMIRKGLKRCMKIQRSCNCLGRGFAGWHFPGHYRLGWSCYLADLAVRDDYQGKGMGKNL